MSLRILLDMDEVLVDFVYGACRAHGVTLTQMLQHSQRGTWSIVEPIGWATGILSSSPSAVFGDDEFWAPIAAQGAAFWRDLPALPWCMELVTTVRNLLAGRGDDWHIISAPSVHAPGSYAGKVAWLQGYFGTAFDRFALTPHKHIFACRNAVLIDDRPQNVDAFREAGGIGVLFPSPMNALAKYSQDPVPYVKEVLLGIIADLSSFGSVL